MTEATPLQIRNCTGMGWEYLGDGIFVKGEYMGWFDGVNFVKDLIDE